MKKLLCLSLSIFFLATLFAQPKIIADGTITYSIIHSDNAEQDDLGAKTIYLKGKDVRVDLTSKRFTQSIFYSGNTGDVTVLKTIGQSKYISFYNAEKWKKQNEVYNGIKTTLTNNTKKILEYDCKQAILNLTNGDSSVVYYVPSIKPLMAENAFEFKDVPGLILEYESSAKGKQKVIYVATKVDFDPVPTIQFEIPKKGYRLLE